MIWLSLIFLIPTLGVTGTMLAAALFGLTIRYDYWSNTVELLAVALVLAAPVLHWHWGYLLAAGLVLGTGRETLPFLGLLGTPGAIAIAIGALASHGIVRCFVRTEAHWEGSLDYANSMLQTNWRSIVGVHGPSAQWQVGIYGAVGLLACFSAPFLAIPLLIVTSLIARIDEPRTLTMLVPFSAQTVLSWA